MGTWTHSWCVLDHVPSENQSNTTPGHLFCNTNGNICATEHWAETQTMCDNKDFLLYAVYSNNNNTGGAAGFFLSKNGLIIHNF